MPSEGRGDAWQCVRKGQLCCADSCMITCERCHCAFSVQTAGGDPKLFVRESPVTLSTLVYDPLPVCKHMS